MKNRDIISVSLLSLFVGSTAVATAQDASPPAPPNVLVIQREYLKPGKAGAIHVKSEETSSRPPMTPSAASRKFIETRC